jgi:hypothetical protein
MRPVLAGLTLPVILLGLCVPRAEGEDFPRIFGARYARALGIVEQNAPSWCVRLSELGVDPEVLLPVVFPELLRSSLIRDEAETLGLALLYVNGGTQRADFSVGRFQMKPSFVEALEVALPSLERLPPGLGGEDILPRSPDGPGVRADRLARLRDPGWQVRYLALFGRVVDSRWHSAALPIEDRIRLAAAAYNRGFWHTDSEIRTAITWRLFPRTGLGAPGPYRYTDVAVDFYVRVWRERYARITAAKDAGRVARGR